ncbi:MAG: hypothetical protein AMS19_14630 [Gemmatimonas sp. SG8_23]|nr:MAG: hypothetical protein AMS19_14630 [Gemmatimonas sp. SG8_23]
METPQKLRDLAISESGFLFDPHTGATFTTNSVGMAILEGLREGISKQELVDRLHERFDVRGDDVVRDLGDFVHLLQRNDLVPHDFDLV